MLARVLSWLALLASAASYTNTCRAHEVTMFSAPTGAALPSN
jgi:hypothetical protein